MSKVYLLRHGRTPWNKDRIFRGRADIPLDDHGQVQACCATEVLGEREITAIYSSPLSRAVQTAKPLSAQKKLQITEVPEFLDIDYGQWTGKSQEEVEELFTDQHNEWLVNPHKVLFTEGESLASVRERAFPKLRELAAAADGPPIVVVSHRVALKVLVCAALELELASFWQIQMDPASLSLLEFDGNRFKLLMLNDTCHLRLLQTPGDSYDF